MPRKPFSGKAKKVQLQAKRERKAGGSVGEVSKNLNLLMKVKNDGDVEEEETKEEEDLKSSSRSGRYKLKFKVESKKELAESREKSQQKIVKVDDRSATTEMYFDAYHDFPVRQNWEESWSKQRLEMTEQKYFREYVDKILSKDEDEDSPESYSYFELNLETWRQFWRVIELSDIILMVVDVRFVTATFPPALYHYIVKEKQKHFILVLNKCDLVEPELPAAWKHYLQEKFPELFVVFFTSFPAYNSISTRRHGVKVKKLRANLKMAKEGSLQILKICEQLTNINLEAWRSQIIGKSYEGDQEEGRVALN